MLHTVFPPQMSVVTSVCFLYSLNCCCALLMHENVARKPNADVNKEAAFSLCSLF